MLHRSTRLALLLTPLLVVSPALAVEQEADIESRLKVIEGSIESDREAAQQLDADAGRLAAELADIRNQMVAASRSAQRHEAEVIRLEQELAALSEEEAAKREILASRREELKGTLAALQRLALRPQAALLVTPADPNDVVRSGLLLRTTVPQIERRAQDLRNQLDELIAVRTRIAARREDLAVAGDALNKERGRLTDLADRKATVLDQTRESREAALARIERLTREAESLEDLLGKLEEDRIARERVAREEAEHLARATPTRPPETGAEQSAPPPAVAALPPAGPPPGATSITAARGSLTAPALGRVVQGYGDRTDYGGTSHGVTYETGAGSLVVAPWDGQVVFAGPFRSFGTILIIEHGEGYHSLLAGLARIDAPVGQWVLAGEPVGVTGGDQSAGGDTTSPDQQPRLYVELRRDGQPINPLPWLAASTDKVNG